MFLFIEILKNISHLNVVYNLEILNTQQIWLKFNLNQMLVSIMFTEWPIMLILFVPRLLIDLFSKLEN